MPKILEKALKQQIERWREYGSPLPVFDINVVRIEGVDIYNKTTTGSVSKTLNSAATDSDHIPCVLLINGETIGNTAKCLDQTSAKPYCNQGENIGLECYDARGNGDGNIAPTLTGDHNNRCCDFGTTLVVNSTAFSIDSLSSNSMKSNNPHSGFHETSIAKCLDTGDGSPNKNQGGTMIVHCNGFNGCYSVNGYDDKQKFPIYCLQGNGIDRADTAGCNGCGWREDKSYTLNTIDRPAVVYSEDKVQYSVRRITPLECCRLQGFPDWWVKDVPHSDSQEYKMWGNGMALPNALYVMQGIVEE